MKAYFHNGGKPDQFVGTMMEAWPHQSTKKTM